MGGSRFRNPECHFIETSCSRSVQQGERLHSTFLRSLSEHAGSSVSCEKPEHFHASVCSFTPASLASHLNIKSTTKHNRSTTQDILFPLTTNTPEKQLEKEEHTALWTELNRNVTLHWIFTPCLFFLLFLYTPRVKIMFTSCVCTLYLPKPLYFHVNAVNIVSVVSVGLVFKRHCDSFYCI